MNASLAELAPQYAHARFVWLSAQSAGFDPEVLPTLLVYKAGELVESLVLRHGALTAALRAPAPARTAGAGAGATRAGAAAAADGRADDDD